VKRVNAKRNSVVRRASWLLLPPVIGFYCWFSFRDDPSLRSLPGMPHFVWFYFDHHTNLRNGLGFLFLAFLAALAVAGLSLRGRFVVLLVCLCSPAAKDFAQDLFAPTRHFSWDAILLGMLGVIVGWGIATWLVRRLSSR
jgi:hypothetical protein